MSRSSCLEEDLATWSRTIMVASPHQEKLRKMVYTQRIDAFDCLRWSELDIERFGFPLGRTSQRLISAGLARD